MLIDKKYTALGIDDKIVDDVLRIAIIEKLTGDMKEFFLTPSQVKMVSNHFRKVIGDE